MASEKLNYVNLGCGTKFHSQWINLDLEPADNSVIRCNFLTSIPFSDASFQVVYHSHVLEHFPKKLGEKFLTECFRILMPCGIIRIVLPDLEKIANEYLKNLSRAISNEPGAEHDYDWIMLEMYDQTVRDFNSGEMGIYLKNNPKNLSYIFQRIGALGTDNSHIRGAELIIPVTHKQQRFSNLFKRIKEKILLMQLNESDCNALRIGRFRQSGEIHQWMYDTFSLSRILDHIGFKKIKVCSANESYIPCWADFKLDNPNETASLYIEAIKP